MYNNKNSLIVTQGDEFKIKIQLYMNDALLSDLSGISLIEFSVDNLTKSYPDEVTYDEENQYFLFPLTQKDTFKMKNAVNYQARVKFEDGTVLGTPIYQGNIRDSISKDVI